MAATPANRMPWWAWAWPALACALLVAAAFMEVRGVLAGATALLLAATVFAAVYHAEVVAHRVGEPFGTLVLAVAVTVIEVSLIVSIMLGGGPETAGLARDTVFAAVMIICNGLVGMCLLWGGARHFEQGFKLQGASAALAVLTALVTLTLVLPNYTTTPPGPSFTTAQLVFAGVISAVLYASFVFVQTVRHRDYFLPPEAADEETHAPVPSRAAAWTSAAVLLIALGAVVGLAKALTPTIEAGVAGAGAPKAVIGIVIAGVVLLPEGLAALRAARANRLQTSLNLALGSALASIGLTIPAVAAVSVLLGKPLALGLGPKEEVLLALTVVVGVVTLGTRPHDGAAGDRPPGDLRRLPVPRGGALASGESFARAPRVMAGLGPAIHAFAGQRAGPSPAPRRRGSRGCPRLRRGPPGPGQPGHDASGLFGSRPERASAERDQGDKVGFDIRRGIGIGLELGKRAGARHRPAILPQSVGIERDRLPRVEHRLVERVASGEAARQVRKPDADRLAVLLLDDRYIVRHAINPSTSRHRDRS